MIESDSRTSPTQAPAAALPAGPGRTLSVPCWCAAGAAFVLFAISALVAHRGGVRLSFDAYYYVEYAKEFRQHAPTSFGSAWPFGWPLLGAGTGLIGLSAYHGLLAFSVASVAALLVLGSFALPTARLNFATATVLLAAVGTLPALSAFVAGVLSEVPFAICLFGFALSLARWPSPPAIFSAAALALAAFTVRYAGGLLLVMLVLWLVLNLRSLRAVGRLPLAIVVSGFACAAAGGLLLWNYTALGMISGHPRGNGVPPAQWLGIAADFGWSIPAALGGLGVRDLLGFTSRLREVLGLALLLGLVGFALHAWWRERAPQQRAFGVVIAGYALGLIALRCQGEFDPLYNARMFVPLLFPLLVLAAWRVPRGLLLALAGTLLVVNAGFNWRGASQQIGGDVRAARSIVASASAGDTIGVNDDALTLAAHVDNRVVRVWPQNAELLRQHRFIVIAAAPLNRSGRPGPISSEWRQACESLVRAGDCFSRLENGSLIVLERRQSAP
jgi:hypothetical protein